MVTNRGQQQIQILQEENQKLRSSLKELSVLNDIAVAISSSHSLDTIIDLIVHKCIRYFKVEQAAVLLLKEESSNSAFQTMVRVSDQSSLKLPYRLNDQLIGWMIKHKSPLLINDFKKDPRFSRIPEAGQPVNSLLSVPLLLKGELIGLICLFNKKEETVFTPGDQRLLAIIASESAQIIENARLHQAEKEYLRTQEELRMAAAIQKQLLPQGRPELPGYDLAAMNLPARSVSGDYYDFIPLTEKQLAFCLGDVSGKGMPAALLTANLQATLRGQVFLENSPAQCLNYSNTLLYNATTPEKFATLFFGVLDAVTHRLTYCNAGHDPPVLLPAQGRPQRLHTGGVVLGFLNEFAYQEASVSMHVNDILLVYSDGITEAMNSSEEEFGEQRLLQALQRAQAHTAETIINFILEEVRHFAAGSSQADDMTLVVIKRIA